jgi:phage shock protein PspC (stress-responsive transcriptional regulator)
VSNYRVERLQRGRGIVSTQTTAHRLRKNSSEKMLFGVCSGLGTYFSIDSVLVRVVFVILTVTGGAGILLYLALAVIMPRDDVAATPGAVMRDNLSAMPQEAVQAARQVGQDVEAAFRQGDPPSSGPIAPASVSDGPAQARRGATTALAIVLIAVGAIFLAGNLGLFRLRWDLIWPAVLIGAGVLLLARRGRHA